MTWWRLALAAVACITAGVLVAWLMTSGPKRPASTSAGVTAVPSSPAPKADPPRPAADTFVLDDFDRSTVTRGLGRARLGGKWKILAEKEDRPDYAVQDSRGIFDLSSPALRRTGYLPQISEKSTDLLATFDLDRLPARGPLFVTVTGRRIDDHRSYATDLYITERGKVRISLTAYRNSETGVTISNRVTAPGAIRARQQVYVRMQTFRVNPTQVQAKVWWGDAAEPDDWHVVKIDQDRDLQRAGSVGFSAYLSKNAKNAPIRVSLWDITARMVP